MYSTGVTESIYAVDELRSKLEIVREKLRASILSVVICFEHTAMVVSLVV